MIGFDVTTFLAWRYLWARNKGGFLRTITRLTFIGIFIASFAFTLTVMITLGFEKNIKSTLRGLSSDAVLTGQGEAVLDDKVFQILSLLKNKNVLAGFSYVRIKQLILQKDEVYSSAIFKGVHPRSFVNVTELRSKIKTSDKVVTNSVLAGILEAGYVILGVKLARELGLKEGDSFTVLVPTIKRRKITLKEKALKLGLVMSVGFDEYDSKMILGSQRVFQDLFEKEEDLSFVMLKFLEEDFNLKFSFEGLKKQLPYLLWQDPLEKCVQRIRSLFSGYSVLAWTALSPCLLASLKIEKIVILLVIGLIMLIGIINMISLIFINVQIKKKDIAVLLALGMTPGQIKSIFVKMGLFISFFATLFAQILAYGCGYFLQKYEVIHLPEIYYVQTVPVDLSVANIVLIFCAVNFIAYLASRIPAGLAAQVRIAEVLRQS